MATRAKNVRRRATKRDASEVKTATMSQTGTADAGRRYLELLAEYSSDPVLRNRAKAQLASS